MIANQILIIQSLIINYPLIRALGFGLDRVLLVCYQRGLKNSLSTCLSTFQTIWKTDTQILSDVDNLLRLSSQSLLIPYVNGKKFKDRVLNYFNILQSYEYDGAIPIIFVEENPPVNLAECCFFVYVEEVEETNNIYACVACEDKLSIIKEMISEKVVLVDNPMERTLKAAACMLYPSLGECRKEILETLLEDCEKIVSQAEMCVEEDSLVDSFVQAFQRTIENVEVRYIVKKPADSLMCDLEKMIFYDSEYIYISESLVKSVVSDMDYESSIYCVCNCLKQNGVLHPNNSGYTSKIALQKRDGKLVRTSCYRFLRARLDPIGNRNNLEQKIYEKEEVK